MRTCGDCQLCCKLLPVHSRELTQYAGIFEMHKPSGQRCQYQKFGVGCAIYGRRPTACRMWTCQWLIGAFKGTRPDRSHYVIDSTLDRIVVTDNKTGKRTVIPAVQVWVDPRNPKAHEDPDL